MEVLGLATGAGQHVAQALAAAAPALFQVNLFWVIVSALNFIVFFVLIWSFAFKPVSAMLADRKAKGEELAEDGTEPSPSESNRRAAPRILVNLEVDYASEDNYLFAYITDISATGIFVRYVYRCHL